MSLLGKSNPNTLHLKQEMTKVNKINFWEERECLYCHFETSQATKCNFLERDGRLLSLVHRPVNRDALARHPKQAANANPQYLTIWGWDWTIFDRSQLHVFASTWCQITSRWKEERSRDHRRYWELEHECLAIHPRRVEIFQSGPTERLLACAGKQDGG